jgi:hypothetical protein
MGWVRIRDEDGHRDTGQREANHYSYYHQRSCRVAYLCVKEPSNPLE